MRPVRLDPGHRVEVKPRIGLASTVTRRPWAVADRALDGMLTPGAG
jgi:hypothetical protein